MAGPLGSTNIVVLRARQPSQALDPDSPQWRSGLSHIPSGMPRYARLEKGVRISIHSFYLHIRLEKLACSGLLLLLLCVCVLDAVAVMSGGGRVRLVKGVFQIKKHHWRTKC